MAASKKLILLRKEATMLLVAVFVLLLAFAGIFLTALYHFQMDGLSPHIDEATIALLDNKLEPLASSTSFTATFSPDILQEISKRQKAGEMHGALTSFTSPPSGQAIAYHTLPDNNYTLITSHDIQTGNLHMQRYFFWGMSGFLLCGGLLLTLMAFLIRQRIVHSLSALIETTEMTESAERAKSEFLACVSHELRTPLNAVIGYSEMLKEEVFGTLGNPKYQEYAENIHTSGSHLLRMINDILEISRAEAGAITLHKNDVIVSALVNACISALEADAKQNGVEIVAKMNQKSDIIHADAAKLQQAVMHIISNAVKFTPAGGTIQVHVNTKADDLLIIQVEDTGVGMSDEELAKAMQGYFSQVDSGLDRRFEGMGLGLSFARKLVELHGGTLIVESIKHKGTTVAMSLPSDSATIPV